MCKIYDLENGIGSVVRFHVETINNTEQVFIYCPQNTHPTMHPLRMSEARSHWDRLMAEGWRVKESENV